MKKIYCDVCGVEDSGAEARFVAVMPYNEGDDSYSGDIKLDICSRCRDRIGCRACEIIRDALLKELRQGRRSPVAEE